MQRCMDDQGWRRGARNYLMPEGETMHPDNCSYRESVAQGCGEESVMGVTCSMFC